MRLLGLTALLLMVMVDELGVVLVPLLALGDGDVAVLLELPPHPPAINSPRAIAATPDPFIADSRSAGRKWAESTPAFGVCLGIEDPPPPFP
jgi:hypothetical protein